MSIGNGSALVMQHRRLGRIAVKRQHDAGKILRAARNNAHGKRLLVIHLIHTLGEALL